MYCDSERLERLSKFRRPSTPKDIPEPSNGRIFREKVRSVYVVKGVWRLLTDLLLNRDNGLAMMGGQMLILLDVRVSWKYSQNACHEYWCSATASLLYQHLFLYVERLQSF